MEIIAFDRRRWTLRDSVQRGFFVRTWINLMLNNKIIDQVDHLFSIDPNWIQNQNLKIFHMRTTKIGTFETIETIGTMGSLLWLNIIIIIIIELIFRESLFVSFQRFQICIIMWIVGFERREKKAWGKEHVDNISTDTQTCFANLKCNTQMHKQSIDNKICAHVYLFECKIHLCTWLIAIVSSFVVVFVVVTIHSWVLGMLNVEIGRCIRKANLQMNRSHVNGFLNKAHIIRNRMKLNRNAMLAVSVWVILMVTWNPKKNLPNKRQTQKKVKKEWK